MQIEAPPVSGFVNKLSFYSFAEMRWIACRKMAWSSQTCHTRQTGSCTAAPCGASLHGRAASCPSTALARCQKQRRHNWCIPLIQQGTVACTNMLSFVAWRLADKCQPHRRTGFQMVYLLLTSGTILRSEMLCCSASGAFTAATPRRSKRKRSSSTSPPPSSPWGAATCGWWWNPTRMLPLCNLCCPVRLLCTCSVMGRSWQIFQQDSHLLHNGTTCEKLRLQNCTCLLSALPELQLSCSHMLIASGTYRAFCSRGGVAAGRKPPGRHH